MGDADRAARDLPGRRRAPLVLRARGELHPHLPGRVRHRRRPAADRDDRGDTPLATGAWVGGRPATELRRRGQRRHPAGDRHRRGQVGGGDHRPCALASPKVRSRPGCRVPMAPGRSRWTRAGSPRGPGARRAAQDTAGNTGDSAPVTARIDNSAPARVDTSVEGGDQWRNSNDFALAWTNPTEVDRAPIAAPRTSCARQAPAAATRASRPERRSRGCRASPRTGRVDRLGVAA